MIMRGRHWLKIKVRGVKVVDAPQVICLVIQSVLAVITSWSTLCMLILLLQYFVRLNRWLLYWLLGQRLLFALSSNHSWFQLLNSGRGYYWTSRTSLFLNNSRCFACIGRNNFAFSPSWIISHSVWGFAVVQWLTDNSFLRYRILLLCLLGREWVRSLRLVHVQVWDVSRLNHSQRVVRSLCWYLLLGSTSTSSFLRFRSHFLSHTWLDANIIIVRVVRVELAVADLSLIFAKSTFVLLGCWLSIVENAIRCKWIVNRMLLAWLLTSNSFILVRVRRQARVSSFVQTLIVLLASVLLMNGWWKTAHHHLIGHVQKRTRSPLVLIVGILLLNAAPNDWSLVTTSAAVWNWWKATLETFTVTHATVLHDFLNCFGHLCT